MVATLNNNPGRLNAPPFYIKGVEIYYGYYNAKNSFTTQV